MIKMRIGCQWEISDANRFSCLGGRSEEETEIVVLADKLVVCLQCIRSLGHSSKIGQIFSSITCTIISVLCLLFHESQHPNISLHYLICFSGSLPNTGSTYVNDWYIFIELFSSSIHITCPYKCILISFTLHRICTLSVHIQWNKTFCIQHKQMTTMQHCSQYMNFI